MTDPVRDELVPGATTDPRHDLAIQALLAGASVQEAADAAGVSRATLWRWRTHDRDFAGRLAEQRAALLEAVIDAMTTEALAAVETLSEIHRDPMQPGAVRVQAVQALLGKLLASHARIELDANVDLRSSHRIVEKDEKWNTVLRAWKSEGDEAAAEAYKKLVVGRE